MNVDDRLWRETVVAERAKLYAQRNPNPPLSGRQVVAVTLLSLIACIAAYAWAVSVL